MLNLKMTFNSKPIKDVKFASKGQVSKYLHDQMVRLWKAGVREFISEAIDRIHVDTGMSMASLSPLAAKVSFKSVLEATLAGKGPKKPRNKGHYTIDGNWIPNVPRSKALGESLGQSAYKLSFGTPKNAMLKFDFNIVVFQYELHEMGYQKYGDKTPWDSLNAGKAAMLAFLENHYDEYINSKKLLDFMLNGGMSYG